MSTYTYTLYVLGDDALLRQSLQAVSMLFDPSVGLFTKPLSSGPSPGIGVGSVAKMGLLFSLMIIIIKGIYRQELRVEEILLSLIVYVALVVPRDNVQVENLYTGTSSLVTNVPFGISAPIGLMSGLTKTLTEKMETAFSTVNSNSIAITAEGFVSPLRLLTSLREGAMRGNGGNGAGAARDRNLEATINKFGQYCLQDASGNVMSHESFLRSSDLIAWYNATSTIGFTVTYDAANPYPGPGTAVPCQTAGQYIGAQLTNWSAATGSLSVADYVRKAFAKPITSGTEMAQVQSALNSLFSTGTVNAQKAMVMFVWSDIMIQSFQDGAIASQDQRLASAAMTEAMERWRSDSAASGEGFSRTMMSGMSLMLFLFIALTPLVITVFMLVGWAGLKLILSWFLFGVWTQSWLPVAAVINFYIQQSVKDAFTNKLLVTQAAGDLFTPAYFQMVYMTLADKLAMASNMLAATPLITLSLLTGSVFSLTSLANKTAGAGGGQFDSKKTTADVLEATGTKQDMANATMFRPGWGTGSPYGSGAITASAVSIAQSDQITDARIVGTHSAVTKTFTNTLNDALKDSHQRQVTAATAVAHGYRQSTGTGERSDASRDVRDAISLLKESVRQSNVTLTNEQWDQVVGKLGADVNAIKALAGGQSKGAGAKGGQGANGPDIDKVAGSLKAGIEAATGGKTSLSDAQMQAFKTAFSAGLSQNLTHIQSGFRQIGHDVTNDATFSKATQDADAISREIGVLNSQSTGLSDSAGVNGSAGSNLSLNRVETMTQIKGDTSGKLEMVRGAVLSAINKIQGSAGDFLNKEGNGLTEKIQHARTVDEIIGEGQRLEFSKNTKEQVLGKGVLGALLQFTRDGSTRAHGDNMIDVSSDTARMMGVEGRITAQRVHQATDNVPGNIAKDAADNGKTANNIKKEAKGLSATAKGATSEAQYKKLVGRIEREYGKEVASLVEVAKGKSLEELKALEKEVKENMPVAAQAKEASKGVADVVGGVLKAAMAEYFSSDDEEHDRLVKESRDDIGKGVERLGDVKAGPTAERMEPLKEQSRKLISDAENRIKKYQNAE